MTVRDCLIILPIYQFIRDSMKLINQKQQFKVLFLFSCLCVFVGFFLLVFFLGFVLFLFLFFYLLLQIKRLVNIKEKDLKQTAN